jgi:LDH2 family malate/lactate/ureidoglycolate dehydrogenase
MKVVPERLKQAAIEILKGLHASEEEALLVTESLVRADMRGIGTHGVNYLKILADRVDAHMVHLPTGLTVVKEDDTTALIDGGNGLGQVAVHQAMEMSIQKARAAGIGCSLVRNTNNIGFLAFYTLMAAGQGMIGIVACNAAPSMSPWGGTEPLLGTNPLSIAVPGGFDLPDIVLDMSSSVVARGKIRRAQRMNENIPSGWALDETGIPTTDPGAALKGTLLPIGGPKGYGLALMIDVIAGILSGSQYGPHIKTFHQLLGPTGIGVFSMAIDMERFMPLHQFRQVMQAYISSVRGTKKVNGVSRIYLPGEIELENERQSLADGIEVDRDVAGSLNELLEKVKSPLRLTEE